VLVYQSRNSPGWGRVEPHAFGLRAAVESAEFARLSADDHERQTPDDHVISLHELAIAALDISDRRSVAVR
jgi:hypothetical protein